MYKQTAFLLPTISMIFLCAFALSQTGPPDVSVSPETKSRIIIEGIISDSADGLPIRHASVQVVGTGYAAAANTDGRFRMIVPRGDCRLKVSHVGYYSAYLDLQAADSLEHHDIRLVSSIIDFGERTAYARAYDPAQRIIAEAIKRKKDILGRLKVYSFDAYVKLVARNAAKPDSESIFLITETQTSAFWERPDKYKEIITARKQSANLAAEGNLVAVGGILNFNRNRIDIGPYSVVSPTATDALDHYNYYLLDTVYIDTRAVFVLEIEPKNPLKPLFVGEIHIADSTFDVVKVDVGCSPGVVLSVIKNPRYHQRLAPIQDSIWLPIEIGFSGLAEFAVPLPGIPSSIAFDYIAALSNYIIDRGHPKGTFGEYELIVDQSADKIDSVEWAARQSLPLTGLELFGYQRLDSLEHAPRPFGKQVLRIAGGGLLYLMVGNYDLFHFNRVEGAYVGLGKRFDRLDRDTRIRLKAGYAFDDKRGQYAVSLHRRIWPERQLWIGAYVRDNITYRPTMAVDTFYNPTFFTLMFGVDPFDYFRERGYSLLASVKPVNHTRLRFGYHDLNQYPLPDRNDFFFFGKTQYQTKNFAASRGHLRTVTAGLTYDSRKMIDDKGRDAISPAVQYLRVGAEIEYASPDIAPTDYHYRRFYVRLQSRVRLLDLGLTSISAMAGSSDWDLPTQRYFIAGFYRPGGIDLFENGGSGTSFFSFGGDRLATVQVSHDFGRGSLRRCGIPLVEKVPFGLIIFGGALWSDFRNRPPDPNLVVAPQAYSEIGFGLTELTPFLVPFNFAAYFAWQLSDYDVSRFRVTLGIRL